MYNITCSPATIILVMVGGLAYAGTGLDETALLIVLFTITVLYGLICLYTSQDFQLKVGGFAEQLKNLIFSKCDYTS